MGNHKQLLSFLGLLALPLAVHAHHSWRAVYGGGEEVTIDATIASEPFRNPHNAVHVQIPNAAGELEAWTVEWRGRRRERSGLNPVEVQACLIADDECDVIPAVERERRRDFHGSLTCEVAYQQPQMTAGERKLQ